MRAVRLQLAMNGLERMIKLSFTPAYEYSVVNYKTAANLLQKLLQQVLCFFVNTASTPPTRDVRYYTHETDHPHKVRVASGKQTASGCSSARSSKRYMAGRISKA